MTETEKHSTRDVAVRPVMLMTGAGGFLGAALSEALASGSQWSERSGRKLAHAACMNSCNAT